MFTRRDIGRLAAAATASLAATAQAASRGRVTIHPLPSRHVPGGGYWAGSGARNHPIDGVSGAARPPSRRHCGAVSAGDPF